MADQSISLNTGAMLDGRALARIAAVTIASSTIVRPAGTTAVEIGSAPTEFSLSQNYPNPFNPSTKIHYSLEKASQVSLKIYNVLGVEVATLINEHQEAGGYTVPFGFNTRTLGISSGVYFYRLEAGSFVSTKKLILMK
jgi:hypothetical protein